MKPLDPRLLPHLRPARAPLAVVVAAQVAGGLTLVGQAFALTALVTAVVRGEPWAAPAVAVAVLLAVRAALGTVADLAAARAARRVAAHLRETVLRTALRLTPEARARHRAGELGLLATRGVAAVEPYLTRYLPALVVAAVLPGFTVLAIATQDLAAAGVVLVTLPLVPVFAALIGMTTQEKADRQWRTLRQLSGHFVDVVRGLPTLVAHRRGAAQVGRIREVSDRHRRASAGVLRLAFASSAALELVATLSVALVAVLVGLRLAGGGLDLPTALVVLLLAPEAYWPLRRVGAEFHAAAEGTATFEEVLRLAGEPRERSGGSPVPEAPAPLALRGVTLRWPGAASPAVRTLDATVPATGLTALVGPSGSGKSTLLAALLGDLDVAGGRVLVGGTDLTLLDRDAWRARVAHLPQRPWLTPDSIAANLRVGRPDATDADLRDALAAVRLLDVVDALPDGLATVLDEDGAGLSAGQRARLALARAVLADRPYVLLDEPTAHLDAATEDVLVDVLRDLARDRCVLVVAHRDAVVAAADHVVRLPAPARDLVGAAVPGSGSGPGRPTAPPAREPVASPALPSPEAPPSGTDDGAGAGTASERRAAARGRLVLAALLGTLASTAGVALTATAGWLIVRSSEQPPVLMLMVAIVGVRTFGVARPVLRYAERLLSHEVALRRLADRRAEVYAALVPLVGSLGRRRGDLLASVVDDVDAHLDDLLRVRLPVVAWAGTTLLTGLVVTALHPVAGAVVALVGLVGGAAAWTTARLGVGARDRERVAARGALSDRVVQLLADAPDLVRWGAAEPALDRARAAGDVLARRTERAARWAALARSWPLLAAAAGVPAVAAAAAAPVTAGTLSAPVAALLVLVPLALVDVAAPVADAGALRVGTRAAHDRLAALTRRAPAVTDPLHPAAAPVGTPRVEADGLVVGWAGRAASPPLALDLTAGSRLAVVGPSGCGKSTLAATLVRFTDPVSGRLCLDGTELRDLRADDVRGTVGLLDDDPHVFSSTLVENVRLARPRASDWEVERALRAAHLGAWLDGLPAGLATRLGEGAAQVSGGERARIGLARMLLADHRVLVLDEPTAHLDRPTADAVAREVLGARDGRTVVWVTHARAGLDRCDAVLDLGEAGGDPHGVRRPRARAASGAVAAAGERVA